MPELAIDDVTHSGAPAAGAGKDPAAGKEETVSISKTELEALRRDRDEARASERTWADMARRNAGGQPTATVEEPEEELALDESEFLDPDAPTGLLPGDTPEKLVEDIAKEGVNALRKRGYISAAEAEKIAVRKSTQVARTIAREVVNTERQKMVSDNQLLTTFPDLKNHDSELFKETAKIYREAVEMDPSAKKTPAALYLAAKAAKQIIDARGGGGGRGADDESEEDRLERVNAQDGRTRGRREAEDDDMMGDQAKEVARMMGVSEEAYKTEKAALRGDRPTRKVGK